MVKSLDVENNKLAFAPDIWLEKISSYLSTWHISPVHYKIHHIYFSGTQGLNSYRPFLEGEKGMGKGRERTLNRLRAQCRAPCGT